MGFFICCLINYEKPLPHFCGKGLINKTGQIPNLKRQAEQFYLLITFTV